MTTNEVREYLANECGTYPYFDHYKGRNSIVVIDADGNEFEVSVKKMAKKRVK